MKISWLIIEFIVASVLCSIPVVFIGALNEQTLQQGMIMAIAFLIPSEIFRQLIPKETILKVIHNKVNLLVGILLFVLVGPVTAFFSANWLNIIEITQIEKTIPIKIVDQYITPSTHIPEIIISIVPSTPSTISEPPEEIIIPEPTPEPIDDEDNSIPTPSSVENNNQEKVHLEFKGLKENYSNGDKVEVDLVETGSRSKLVDLWFAIQTPDSSYIFVPSNALNSKDIDNNNFVEDKEYAMEIKPYESSVKPQIKEHNKIIELKIPSKEPPFSEELFFTKWGKGSYTLYAVYVEKGKNPVDDGEEYFRSNLVEEVFTWKEKGDIGLPKQDSALRENEQFNNISSTSINRRFFRNHNFKIKKYDTGLELNFLRIGYIKILKHNDKFNVINREVFNKRKELIYKIYRLSVPFNINIAKISKYLSTKLKLFENKFTFLDVYDTKERMNNVINRFFSEEEIILSCQLVLITVEIIFGSRNVFADVVMDKLKIEIFEDFLTDFSDETKENLSEICYELKPIEEWKNEFEKLIKNSGARIRSQI